MKLTPAPIPAKTVFEKAVSTNRARGHENEGFLSQEYGFLPAIPPFEALPASHEIWDSTASRLPELFKNLAVRQLLDELPLLPATEKDLPDKYLLRASSLLGILAHAYYRVETELPDQLPACLLLPWTEVSRRLGKLGPFLFYIDLILYNWKRRNENDPSIVVENLDLLFPTVGNEEERIFYLTQVEIAAASAPLVTAVIRSQEAVVEQDNAALERELLLMLETLQHISEVSFQKIDPNPYSQNYVDQVVWAKSVAPFAIPINPQNPGPSGTAAPVFHLLDAFFSRSSFETVLGHEARRLATYSPIAWQALISAVAQVKVNVYVDTQSSAALLDLFYQVLEAYAGDKGYLGIHRLKVYGYLENAFKVGRSVTIGGFRGLFKNKTWNQVDRELSLTRDERYQERPNPYFLAKVKAGRTVLEPLTGTSLNLIKLDLSHSGFRYRPGDRVGVLPQNSPVLVERTIKALRGDDEVKVQLNRRWQDHFSAQAGQAVANLLPLRHFLKLGKIRPVSREAAKHLYGLSASTFLRKVLAARSEDQWELWELLEKLQEEGFDPTRLWKAGPGEPKSICRIVPPETYRLYSIASSSAFDVETEATSKLGQKEEGEDEDGCFLNKPGQGLELIVSDLKYKPSDEPSRLGQTQFRYGTASSYLQRLTSSVVIAANQDLQLKIIPAPRFHLPKDPSRPVVMFAAGSGIAPFPGFLQVRLSQPGPNWLFLAARSPGLLFYREEMESLLVAGKLQVKAAFSASHQRLVFNGEKLIVEEGEKPQHLDTILLEEENTELIWDLLRPQSEGGQEAFFYVCGQPGFATTVME